MSVITVKEVRIKNTGGTYDTQPIGAEGQYIDISRDATGEIIEDITAPGVVVASTEGLAETLKNIEESVADSNEFSEMTDVDFTSLADKNLVQYDNTTGKWKNIAMDTTPTASSNKPVTSGGVKTALDAKANDADLKAVAKTGNASDVNYTNTTSGLTATKVQAAIDEVDSNYGSLKETLTQQINENGSKNICPLKVVNQTVRGITITDSADGTYKVLNGTSTGNPLVVSLLDELAIYPNNDDFSGYTALTPEQLGIDRSKTYVFARNSYNNVRQRLVLYLNDGTVVTTLDIGTNSAVNSIEIDFSQYTFDRIGIFLLLGNNNTYSNYALKPILMLKSDWQFNNAYTPYAKTNQLLTKETTGLIDNQNVNGAINTLPNNATTQVINGVTFTVNSDGTVTANGTATTTPVTLDIARLSQDFNLEVGKTYKLSGAPSNANCFIKISSLVEVGNGQTSEFIYDGKEVNVQLLIRNKATVSNLTFKPMITVPSYDGDYVPYAKSNKELTEDASLVDIDFPSTVSGYSYSSNSYVLKKNGIVDLNFAVKQSLAGDGTEVKIFTLPTGSRPKGQIIVPIYRNAFELGTVIKGWVRIATNGEVSIFNNSGTAYEYLGTKVTFIAYQ